MTLGLPDIAALSVASSHTNNLSQVGVALLSNALDNQEVQGDSMVKMMEQSVNPNVGGNFDVRV
ncbi:MAG: YjfB family protein [Lachnospiraceae bacterium]|nr:YjfB family protein [Lachnospiraceae bacterium]